MNADLNELGRKRPRRRTRALRALLAGGMLLTGCVTDDDAPPSTAADATGTSDSSDPSGSSQVVTYDECQPSSSAPTWSEDIAPIFDEHCADCHSGDSALVPALLTYADMVATNEAGVPLFERSAVRIEEGNMPPANLPAMTDAEIEAVFAWVAACAPESL